MAFLELLVFVVVAVAGGGVVEVALPLLLLVLHRQDLLQLRLAVLNGNRSQHVADVLALAVLVVGRQLRLVDAFLEFEVAAVFRAHLQASLEVAPPAALGYLVEQQVGASVVVAVEAVGGRDELLDVGVQRLDAAASVAVRVAVH